MNENQGVQFGRYKLQRLLGEGGMAQVWHAVQGGLMGFEKEVAIKKLKAGVSEEDRLVKSLINEARLGGFLRNPHIVEVYEFDKVGENFYLAMEYVDGPVYESVVKHYRKKQEYMSVRSVMQAMIDACKGLEFAHKQVDRSGAPLNLIHRDMKPGNMMIERTGVLKLMDFGIARAESNLYKTTSMNMTKGTPVYMSPEQVRGEELDHRSDIWAMGAILYELVTLRVLFKAPNLVAVMNRVLTRDIGDAVEVIESFHPGLGAILDKSLANSPAERYATAAEMQADLEEVMKTVPADQPSLADTIAPVCDERDKEIEEATAKTAQMNSLTDAPAQGQDALVQGLAAAAAQTPGSGGGPSDPNAATIAAAPAATGGAMPASTGEFFQDSNANLSTPSSATMEMPGGYGGQQKSRTGLIIGLLLAVILIGGGGATAYFLSQQNKGGEPEVDIAALVQQGIEAGLKESEAKAAAQKAADEKAAADKAATEKSSASSTAKSSTRTEKPTATTSKAVVEDTNKPTNTSKPVASTSKPVAVTELPASKKVVEQPPPAVKEVAPSGTGKLFLNSRPWSEVYIDGKHIRSTPVTGYEVSAGRHTIKFDCLSLEKQQTITVDVKDGDQIKKFVQFEKDE